MANFSISTKKILSASNIKRIIMLGISLKNGIESIEQDLIKEYDTTKTYSPDMAVYYNDYLYRCLFTTTGEFDINSWKKVGDSLELVNKAQVEAMLGLTPDELDTLANIILDSEVRLDKTWSSSKIYESVQAAIRENKTFTLQEFAKANKASYNVVSATSEMTDKSVIYLMSNNTNYDMYIVESDGTPTKIGDTKIDLSQYAKLSDLNNYYDKVTSDGKYATITTVDGKVDKTSILSTISSTPSDDKLLSEKAIDDTLVKKTDIVDNLTSTDTDKPLSVNQGKILNDKKVDKTSIVTSIDSSSTDTQVPSAKSIKTELDLKEDVSNKTTTINSSSTNTQYPSAKSVYDLAGNENRRGYVYNNPTYRGDKWNRVFRVNSLISCDSGFLTVTVYSSGLCQIATFLMSKNFNRLSIKQINCGGYNGVNGKGRPIKVRIISAETSAYSFLEIYVSGTSNTNVVATYMPLHCNSVVVLNEEGSIPSGMFACEMTATHDTYDSATYTSVLK